LLMFTLKNKTKQKLQQNPQSWTVEQDCLLLRKNK
jgi:hypothetical protein